MKWKRYQIVGMSAGAFVFASIAATAFLLGTQPGLRWIGSGAEWAVDGLSIGRVSGSLLHLRLEDVCYEAPGIDLQADLLSYDILGEAVFSNRLVVEDVRLSGLKASVRTADLTPSDTTEETPSEPITELRAPIPFFLQNLTLSDIDVEVDGLRAGWRDLTLSGRWFERHAVLTSIAWTGARVAMPETQDPPKTEPSKADTSKTALAASAEEPAVPLGEQLTALFSKPLLPELPTVTLPLDVTVEDLVVADADIVGNRITSLRAAADWKRNVLTLSRFTVEGAAPSVSAFSGSLTGTVGLTGKWPVALKLDAEATLGTPEAPQSAKVAARLAGAVQETIRFDTDLKAALPMPVEASVTGEVSPAVAGLPLSLTIRSPGYSQDAVTLSGVDVVLTGSARDYKLTGRTHVRVDKVLEGDLTVDGNGTEKSAHLEALKLATDRGTVAFSGDVDWPDAVRWHTKLTLEGIDTGTLIFPEAPIRLAGYMQTQGYVKGAEWVASLKGVDIEGTIQKAPIELKGSFAATSDGSFLSPGLDVRLGVNTFNLHGEVKVEEGEPRFNVQSTISAPDFSRAIPGSTGRAEGHFYLKGRPAFPILDVDIDASNLSFADYVLADLRLKGGVAQGEEMMGDLTLTAEHFAMPGVTLETANLRLRGKERKHNLTLAWTGTPASGEMTLSGDFLRDAQTWTGALTAARIGTPVGDVQLKNRMDLRYRLAESDVRVGTHCWTHESAEVCLKRTATVDLTGKKALPLQVALEHFDLGYFRDQLPRRIAVDGRLKGEADLTVPAGFKGLPSGRVTVESEGLQGTIRMPEEDFVLGFEAFKVAGELRDKRISFDWLLDVARNGSIAGRIVVDDPVGEKRLTGTLRMDDLSVAMINPLLSTGEKAEGTIYGDLAFGGTLLSPTLTGETGIRDVKLDSTKLPFEMLPSHLALRFGGQDSVLEGLLKTPQGEARIDGNASWATLEDWRAKVSVRSRKLRLTVPPMAELDLSTYVSFEALPEKYRLEGLVSVPWARIQVTELPDSAVSVSADEVRLDRPGSWKSASEKSGPKVPIETTLFIVVGDDVRVDAMGLKAALTGKLSVAQYQSSLGLNGQITVPFGQFRAYGQDLIVRKGEILFSGPVSNPLLNLEAVRNPERTADDVVAGVRVTGTAQRPKAVIFSEPALSEQEAFSYLLRGEGLDPSGDTDNSAITTALIGLGLSQSSGLLTEMGDAIGLQDLGLDTEGAGESSQVVVSAYVLPGLKVKYGVGLFDSLATLTLRYRLLPRLYFEAVSGVDQAVNLLYQFDF